MTEAINISALAKAVKNKREEKGVGLRKAAREINGITHMVLYDIEHEKIPKLENYVRVCHWLGVSADYFTYRYQNNIEITDKNSLISFLSRDEDLEPETAKALIKMVKLAYA